ncbi:hypothetical protein JF540_15790 [Salipiger thiooxidans]|uniref:hypothetical protein n=1 Tax=Salipiger thiooxidans TaxID=282683 RepID=UPI001A8F1ED3|nr:hypothetical protein [Salipiger thiooxidans]MBN8188155.1 hypothetical protein [Salipiger thiooxidans]
MAEGVQVLGPMAPPLPKEQPAAGPGTAASSASLSAVLVNAMIVTAHETASNPAFPILRRGPAPPAAAASAQQPVGAP